MKKEINFTDKNTGERRTLNVEVDDLGLPIENLDRFNGASLEKIARAFSIQIWSGNEEMLSLRWEEIRQKYRDKVIYLDTKKTHSPESKNKWFLPNSTQVPNIFWDDLPHMSNSELRLVLVVIRQTLGWEADKVTGRRKEKDWISGTQLQKKSGVSNKSISRAFKENHFNKWIEVLDESDNKLDTPEKRRYAGQHHKKFFYRLKIEFETNSP